MSKLRVITGHNRTGLFSVATVLLENLILNQGEFQYKVELGPEYLYFDTTKGLNVWEYFFKQPMNFSERHESQEIEYGFLFDRIGLLDVANRSTSYFDAVLKAAEIFRNQLNFAEGVESVLSASKTQLGLSDKYIAVHKRETDYELHANSIPSSDVFFREIENQLGDEDIFLATDSTKAYWDFKMRYGKRLKSLKVDRSSDSTGLHFKNYKPGFNWINGLNALKDAYVLSQGASLYRTRSNLTTFSLILNPDIRCIEMDQNIVIA